MSGDPRREVARLVGELEELVGGGAHPELVKAKIHEASTALRHMVETGDRLAD